MGNQYFAHEIRTGNSSQKGIAICDTEEPAEE